MLHRIPTGSLNENLTYTKICEILQELVLVNDPLSMKNDIESFFS